MILGFLESQATHLVVSVLILHFTAYLIRLQLLFSLTILTLILSILSVTQLSTIFPKASQVLISGPQGLLFGLLGSHPGGLISLTFIFTTWAYLWPPPRPTVGLVACLVCSLISKCLFAHCELFSAYSLNFLIIFHSLFIITPSYTSVCFCVAYLELIQALNFKFSLKPQLISK